MRLTPERWQQVKEILDAALKRPPGDRATFLEDACGQDAALLKEVESLLASAHIGEALEHPLLDDPRQLIDLESETSAAVDTPSLIGRSVGPYRMLKELGRGGMGAVYLAVRDDEQFKKRVAVKILRPGMDSGDIVRRFRNERQILAGIDHPNIARLLDGGSTEEGLPYFVMEYVDGKAIDEYCDTGRLSVSERLRLFRPVCDAVHFAHQNLVVHRDLKPANILVTADGVPKLLDFGIAKLLNPELASGTIDPTFGSRPMTPEYASPEQIRGESVTTASDVYSMGVLLYELLTGHRPYRLRDRQFHEIVLAVCEEEPARPSAVIDLVEEVPAPNGTTRKITPESVSSTREGTRERLRRRLKGDLDNICLMAMRKEPRRRYGSVEQLSEDIGRVLDGLPVKARKPTFAYRGSKFVRRHKVGVAAVAVLLMSILAFSIVVVRERDRAEKEAAKAKAINEFLLETLGSADPLKGAGRNVTVVEALAKAEKRIEPFFQNQPEVKVQVQYTIGVTYYRLGLYDKAIPLLESSLSTASGSFGGDERTLASILNSLATMYDETARYQEAEPLFKQAIELREKTLGPSDPQLASTLSNLANMYVKQARYAEAESLYRRAADIKEKALGPDDVSVGFTLNNLAILYQEQGKYKEAEQLLLRCLRITEKHSGPEHPDVATALSNLGDVYTEQGRYSDAESTLRRALEITEKAFGAEHPDVAVAMTNLGRVYHQMDRHAEAERFLLRSVAINEKAFGPEHPNVATALLNLAILYGDQEKYSDTERLLLRCLQIKKKNFGDEHPSVARILANLGELHIRKGTVSTAEVYLRRALQIFGKEELRGPNFAATSVKLAKLCERQNNRAEAERLYTQALDIYEKALGSEHPDSKEIRESLARLRAPQGRR